MYLYAEVDGLALKARGQTPAAAFLAHIGEHWPTRKFVVQQRLLSAYHFTADGMAESVAAELRAALPVLAAHEGLMLTTLPEVRWYELPTSEAHTYGQTPAVEDRLARIVAGVPPRPGYMALAQCRALALPLLSAP